MRLYETTFLVNPQTDDVTIDRQVNDVIDIIKSNGGKIVHEDRMGTRRMAYAIKGLTQAYYTSLMFEGETSILPELDRHYRLGEAYLRNLTVIFEGDLNKLQAEEEEDLPHPQRYGRDERRPAPPRESNGPVGRREAAPAAQERPPAPVAEAPVAEPVAEAKPEPTPEPIPEPEKKEIKPTAEAGTPEDEEL